jgi:hypothetical protein
MLPVLPYAKIVQPEQGYAPRRRHEPNSHSPRNLSNTRDIFCVSYLEAFTGWRSSQKVQALPDCMVIMHLQSISSHHVVVCVMIRSLSLHFRLLTCISSVSGWSAMSHSGVGVENVGLSVVISPSSGSGCGR